MIKTVTSSSPYIDVQCFQGNSPYISPGAQSAGMVRYSLNSQQLEIYDGNTWLSFGGGYANVGLNPVAKSAIDWVIEQMAKESEMKELAKKHASIQHALDNVEQAKKELELIYQLAKDHSNGQPTTV